MRKIILMIFASLLFVVPAFAQATATATPAAEAKPKRASFRANKEQIKQAQKMLKVEETGKMDDAFRAAVKKFQAENALAEKGSLNRATLEKMNIALTDAQKAIPVTESSLASGDSSKSGGAKKRGPVFRANKDQVTQAQTMLKTKGMYAGEATGKLDDATRDGIRKFQTGGGVKVTGTLNKETLVKMGITLTDKQKEM